MSKFETSSRNRKRAGAFLAAFAVASTALVGGTLASFTDRDAASKQTLSSGTLEVDLTEGATWDTAALKLAVGDEVKRRVRVRNTGSLPIGSMKLSSAVVDTKTGLDPTANLSTAIGVNIEAGGAANFNYTRLSDLDDYEVGLYGPEGLPPGRYVDLVFTYYLIGARTGIPYWLASSTGAATYPDPYTSGARTDFTTNPDNRYQDASVSITYTVNAVQAPGASKGAARVAPTPAQVQAFQLPANPNDAIPALAGKPKEYYAYAYVYYMANRAYDYNSVSSYIWLNKIPPAELSGVFNLIVYETQNFVEPGYSGFLSNLSPTSYQSGIDYYAAAPPPA